MYVDPGVPAEVIGDATRLRQILVNLIGNGVKFTERGGVRVTVTCRASTETDALMEIKIRDSGIGIASENIDLIFEKFTQADGSMTRRHGGTGLGLTIVKQLVDLMDGRLNVESRVGEGSIGRRR